MSIISTLFGTLFLHQQIIKITYLDTRSRKDLQNLQFLFRAGHVKHHLCSHFLQVVYKRDCAFDIPVFIML